MNKAKGIFWLAVLGLHSFFFFFQIEYQSGYFKDSGEYLQSAQNILQVGSYYCGDFGKPIRMDNYTKRPPVYPVLIAGIQLIFGSDAWLMALQTILSLFNIYLLIQICRKIYPSVNHYLLFLPFIILYPAQFIYANAVMTEVLFQSLLLGMVFYLLKLWDSLGLTEKAKGVSRPVLIFSIFTLLLILAIWTKPVFYLFIFIHLIGGGILAWKKRNASIVILALFPLILVGTYMNRNEKRTGYFHFSSIQNLSLLQYSTTYLLISKYGEEVGYQKADEILYRSLAQENYDLEQRSLQTDCMDTILNNPFRYVLLHVKGMLNFFLDPGRYDLYAFFQIEDRAGDGMLKAFSQKGYSGIWRYLGQQPLAWVFLLGMVFLLNVIKLAGLIIFGLDRTIPAAKRGILMIMILYLAFLTGISGASRFAVPVFPIMLIVLPAVLRFIPKAISSKMKAY